MDAIIVFAVLSICCNIMDPRPLIAAKFRRSVYGPSLWEDEVIFAIDGKMMVGEEYQSAYFIQGKKSIEFFPSTGIMIYHHLL